MQSLRIETRRGSALESSHAVNAVVTTSGGQRVAWSGRADRPTFLRSAAKPFQALPLIRDGAADRFQITSRELALICASHSSEPVHVDGVRSLLRKIGCDETQLVCGPHRPLSRDLTLRPHDAEAVPDGTPRGGVHNNCSGKHAGMLALATHHGWPVTGYEAATHRVQRRCRDELAAWAECDPAVIGEGIDGCGVTCFSLPLDVMAASFARFGASPESAARQVRDAMIGHPELVAGQYRLCTELMRAYPGEVVAKVGAAGVYGAALPRRGLGIALKIEDGDARAAMIGLIAVLDAVGLEPRPSEVLPRFATIPVLNTRGHHVGVMCAAGGMSFD